MNAAVADQPSPSRAKTHAFPRCVVCFGTLGGPHGDDLEPGALRRELSDRHLDHLARRARDPLRPPAIAIARHDEHLARSADRHDLLARARWIHVAHRARAELVLGLQDDLGGPGVDRERGGRRRQSEQECKRHSGEHRRSGLLGLWLEEGAHELRALRQS